MAKELLRKDLEALPERFCNLQIDARGYPVPWFVAWVNGQPEFRASDPQKFWIAVKQKRCWVCGTKLGSFKTFVTGPMCGINRITAEPPCHLECAEWSARNCPFLKNPNTIRRKDGLEDCISPGGEMLEHNPGVTLLWTTKAYNIVKDGRGGYLISIGQAEHVKWYCRGREASVEEITKAIEKGYPKLRAMAETEGDEALTDLSRAREKFQTLVNQWPPFS